MTMAQSDASNAPSYRGLLALVIFLGVLIVLGVSALILAAVLRAGNRQAAGAEAAPAVARLAAPGKTIQSAQLEGGRILVRLAGSEGEELVILDSATGRVIARIAIDTRP
jgi:hypothetical protein